jgi:hypothetical protein
MTTLLEKVQYGNFRYAKLEDNGKAVYLKWRWHGVPASAKAIEALPSSEGEFNQAKEAANELARRALANAPRVGGQLINLTDRLVDKRHLNAWGGIVIKPGEKCATGRAYDGDGRAYMVSLEPINEARGFLWNPATKRYEQELVITLPPGSMAKVQTRIKT